MKVVTDYQQVKIKNKSIITIGTFDGVHIGHQKIIASMVALASKEKLQSVLLTFWPHPRMVLQPDQKIKLINSIQEKQKLLEETGLDILIIQPFDSAFSRLSALEFVRNILVNQLNMSHMFIGHNHRFGKNREGSFDQLVDFGHTYDFKVIQIEAQNKGDISVSSTKIRNAILDGDLRTAKSYMGRPYSIEGVVEKGNQIGQQIGFPTANIGTVDPFKILPKDGVYFVSSVIEDNKYFGMMNIGNRPTVNGINKTIEVHFFDFNKDIYQEKISVNVLDFLRAEEKFYSIEALKKQIERDKIQCLQRIKDEIIP